MPVDIGREALFGASLYVFARPESVEDAQIFVTGRAVTRDLCGVLGMHGCHLKDRFSWSMKRIELKEYETIREGWKWFIHDVVVLVISSTESLKLAVYPIIESIKYM